mgnify:CR=1 FL=1
MIYAYFIFTHLSCFLFFFFSSVQTGGFYDHVAPPSKDIPPPDNSKSYPDEFDFKRLGIRIPFGVQIKKGKKKKRKKERKTNKKKEEEE